MSHPFGDLVWQHLVRKRGLSQNKLAIGIGQDRAVVTRMCNGRALTGPQSRERVVAVIDWLHRQGVLDYVEEANALLASAGKPWLSPDHPVEASLLGELAQREAPTETPQPENTTAEQPRATATSRELPARQAPPLNPYRGLFAFREEDAPFFCGREGFTSRLIEAVHVQHKRLAAVIGPSGSGKSSVVFAGLVPQLRHTRLGGWTVASFRPGDQPFQTLSAALVSLIAPGMSEVDRLGETNKLAAMLRQGEVSIYDAAARIGSGAQDTPSPTGLLLVADQFEELFTLCRDAEERHLFLDRLLAAVSQPEPQTRAASVCVVLTLRADFLSSALSYRPLVDALQDADLKLGPMTRTELQNAIEAPARQLGVTMESGLTKRILDAVGEEPGDLPLLEFALTLLWARQSDGVMTHAAYDEMGGVEKALAGYAEEVYGELTAREQQQARRIFVQLVQPGEATEDTRRLASRREIGDENWDLVTRLAGTRLVVTDRNEATGEETVELVHEALITGWDRLKQWVEADRAFRTWQERLRAALHQWETSGRDEGALLRGVSLDEAAQWLRDRPEDLGRGEESFIRAGLELRDRERSMEIEREQRELALAKEAALAQRRAASRLRYIAALLTLLLLVSLGLSFLAVSQGSAAASNASRAEANEALAQANAATAQAELANSDALRFAAEANTLLQTQGSAEVIGLLSVLSMRTHYSPQGDAALEGAATLDYPRRQFTGHSDAIWGAAFSPDGKYVLTGSGDNTARLWDTSTGKEVRQFTGHTAPIISVAFSPDGKYAVTASHDGTARLWNVSTGAEVRRFVGHSDGVWGVAYSPDGKYILTGSADKTARLWDASTGQEIRRFVGHEDIVYGVAFSPDGKYVLTAGTGDKTARLWDAATGQEIRRFTGESGIVLVTFSPDGKYVLASSWDKTAWLWDASTGQEIRRFVGHAASTKAVAFSPDGQTVLTSSDDATARLWDLQTGQETRRLIGHTSGVYTAAFSPDSKYILTAGGDKTALLWDAHAQSGLPEFVGHTDTINTNDVTFSPDGKYVLTGSFDKTVRLWDAATGKQIRTFTGHTDHVTSVAFSPDGKQVLTSSDDKSVRVWNTASGQQLRSFSRPGESVTDAEFSPDGRYIVSAGAETLPIWDVQSGALVRVLQGNPSLVHGAAFSPDGKMIATAGTDKTVRLWDATTGKEIRRLEGHTQQLNSVDFSPDGKSLVSCADGGTARLWDTATGKELRVLLGHTDRVSGCKFSPDGKYVLTASGDKTARLWNVSTGQEMRRYTGHTEGVLSVAFSPDGKYVLTGSSDKTARLWFTDYRDTINYVCGRLVRDFSDPERTAYDIAAETPVCGRQQAP